MQADHGIKFVTQTFNRLYSFFFDVLENKLLTHLCFRLFHFFILPFLSSKGLREIQDTESAQGLKLQSKMLSQLK